MRRTVSVVEDEAKLADVLAGQFREEASTFAGRAR